MKKIVLVILSMFLALNINVLADNTHTHTDYCYYGTKHICSGDEKNGGGCYGSPVYTYHKHTGQSGLSVSNGCYTTPVNTYHTHVDACYQDTNKDCPHTVVFSNNGELETIGLYSCPSCGNETFNGYKKGITCEHANGTIDVYAGSCSSCGYTGNSTWINDTIENNEPCSASYTHSYIEKELICGKDTTTIDKVEYVLGCGKTEESIDKIQYKKLCNKENNAFYDSYGKKVSPQCHYIVDSIKPKVKEQKTKTPDFTIYVTYLDGHVEEAKASKADWNKNVVYNNNDIVLYYSGKTTADGKINTLTTVVKLTTPVEYTATPTPTKRPTATPTPIKITQPAKVTITPLATQVPTQSVLNGLEDEFATPTPTQSIDDELSNPLNVDENSTITDNDVTVLNDTNNSQNGTSHNILEDEGINVEEEKASMLDLQQQAEKSRRIKTTLLIIGIIISLASIVALIIYFIRSKMNDNYYNDDDNDDDELFGNKDNDDELFKNNDNNYNNEMNNNMYNSQYPNNNYPQNNMYSQKNNFNQDTPQNNMPTQDFNNTTQNLDMFGKELDDEIDQEMFNQNENSFMNDMNNTMNNGNMDNIQNDDINNNL